MHYLRAMLRLASGREAMPTRAIFDARTMQSTHATPADEQERAWVGQLAEAVREVTGESVEVGFVDQGYTGEAAAEAAQEHGIRLEVVKLSEAKRGFVLLRRRALTT